MTLPDTKPLASTVEVYGEAVEGIYVVYVVVPIAETTSTYPVWLFVATAVVVVKAELPDV